MLKFHRILFPVSLTRISPKLVPYIESMADKYDAEIHLLHVSHEFDQYVDSYVNKDEKTQMLTKTGDFEKEFLNMAEKKLLEFKNIFFKEQTNIKTSVITGQDYIEILNYITDKNIDLVIMGTGRGFHKAIFGSVTDKVAKLSKAPVLLVKTA